MQIYSNYNLKYSQHFTATSRSLQMCSGIIYNILIVPEFIQ